MNKILTMLALGLALSVQAATVNWQPQDILNSQIWSVTVSNKLSGLTNTQAPLNPWVTNAIQDGLYGGGSNQPQNVIVLKGSYAQGTIDGDSGTKYYAPGTTTTLAATNSWGLANLFQDAYFWCDGEGRLTQPIYVVTNTLAGIALPAYELEYTPNLPSITIVAQVTNAQLSNLTFRFAPVWDGLHVSTNVADIWTVGMLVGGAAAGQITVLNTNVPQNTRFPGAKALRLLDVTDTTTSAGAVAVLRSIKMHGFHP